VTHATIDRARPDDVADLLRLLEQNQLPTAGIRDHLTTALVAREQGEVVGSAALEVYPEGALLRSVAVAPALQRRGLGRQLTDAAIRLAQELRVPAMYLLTTTAETFFPKFGFERMARADVPLSVQASVEFTSACPSTATVMRKRLPTFSIRAATIDDLPALTDIYNHYVLNTAITFDKQPFSPEQRRAWFDDHAGSGRYRLLVAIDSDQKRLGYATTSRWRPKAAYDTTVEASVYCHPDAVGRGCGSALYTALFASIGAEDVHTIVAGVALPNPASIRLHERFGFRPVGVFHGVGRKFDKFWDVAWFERPLRT
jgi:phosphinothricin acetyltransferase